MPLNPREKRPIIDTEGIHDTVVNIIYKMDFEDWARYTFRIKVLVVMAFFKWAANVSDSLRAWYATQKEYYEEVERVYSLITG